MISSLVEEKKDHPIIQNYHLYPKVMFRFHLPYDIILPLLLPPIYFPHSLQNITIKFPGVCHGGVVPYIPMCMSYVRPLPLPPD